MNKKRFFTLILFLIITSIIFFQIYNNKLVKNTTSLYKIILLDSTMKLDFITKETHPKIFSPEINYKLVKDKYKNTKIFFSTAAAFTPDWKRLEGLVIENGVTLPSKLKNHGAYVLINKDKKNFSIILESEIKSKEDFIKSVHKKKQSLFEQIPLIYNYKDIRNKYLQREPGKNIYRFLFKTKNNSGIIYFEKEYYLEKIISILKETKIKGEKIRDLVYLDMGSVSESYHCLNDICTTYYDKDFSQKKNGYTNLIIFYEKK